MKAYYEADNIVIYHGDCLEVLPALGRNLADAVIADPPFAIPTDCAKGRGTTRSVGDLSIVEAAFRAVFETIKQSLKPTGRAFVFCDGTSYPVMFRAAYSNWSTACLVWDKGIIGMGREFRKSHELILHCWQDDTPIFADGIGRPDVLKSRPVHHTDKLHDAQKPLDLIEQLLPLCGSVVVDPFSGTGTTLIAAKAHGMRAIGVEIEEQNCEIAASRLAQGVLPFGEAVPA